MATHVCGTCVHWQAHPAKCLYHAVRAGWDNGSGCKHHEVDENDHLVAVFDIVYGVHQEMKEIEKEIHTQKNRLIRVAQWVAERMEQDRPKPPPPPPPKRVKCPTCNGTGFIGNTCCRKCEGSMSIEEEHGDNA